MAPSVKVRSSDFGELRHAESGIEERPDDESLLVVFTDVRQTGGFVLGEGLALVLVWYWKELLGPGCCICDDLIPPFSNRPVESLLESYQLLFRLVFVDGAWSGRVLYTINYASQISKMFNALWVLDKSSEQCKTPD